MILQLGLNPARFFSKFPPYFQPLVRRSKSGYLMLNQTTRNLLVCRFRTRSLLFTSWSRLDTFLQINDQINTVLGRYGAFKRGDYATSSNPIPAELAAAGTSQGLSLIDFDDGSQTTTSEPQGGVNDLAGLFSSGPPLNPMPAVGSSTNPYAPSPMSTNGNGYGLGAPGLGVAPGLTRPSMSPPQLSATPPASIMLPTTPAQRSTPTPNYFGNNGNVAKGPAGARGVGTLGTGTGMNIGFMAPQSSQLPRQQQVSQPASANSGQNQQQGKDPFADLAGLF